MNPLGQLLLHNNIESDKLAIAPDSRHFALAAAGGLLRFYDMTQPTPSASGAPVSTDGGHGVLSLKDGPDAPLSGAVTLPGGGVAATPDAGWGPPRTILPAEEVVGNKTYQIEQAAAAPNGRMLAVLWNGVTLLTQGGRPIDEITGGGMMELRDARTGRLLRTLLTAGKGDFGPTHGGALGQPTLSRDGRLVAVADETGRVLLWDAAAGHRAGQMSAARAASGSTVEAFAENGFRIAPILAFSPDGRFLAAGRDDGSIYLYSLRTMLPVAQIGQLNSAGGGRLRADGKAVTLDGVRRQRAHTVRHRPERLGRACLGCSERLAVTHLDRLPVTFEKRSEETRRGNRNKSLED